MHISSEQAVRSGRSRHATVAALLALLVCAGQTAIASDKDDGFKPIFDGKTLENWDGNPKFWRVEDGAITGQTTSDNPTKGNTFIIWRGGEVGDFELTLEYRIVGGNSGVQYRSFEVPGEKWVVGGYQADFEAGDTYSGILYGERFRGILANRGQKTVLHPGEGRKVRVEVVGSVGDSDEIQKKIRKENWNTYRVVARGFDFTHWINDVKTIECTDKDERQRRATGILALQLHAGDPMKVQFRNIRLKRLDEKDGAGKQTLRIELRRDETLAIADKPVALDRLADRIRQAAAREIVLTSDPDVPFQFVQQVIKVAQQAGIERFSLRARPLAPAGTSEVAAEASEDPVKNIALIAGKPSHGYGAHEHRAGCLLLAKALNESGLPVRTEVYTGGWPEDPSVLDAAATIVIYADGGGGHPFNAHIDELNRLMAKGIGLVAIHYAVEVPKGKSGDAFLDWTGGYFEANWSVNPHWTAEYAKLPRHPIANGVKPFAINDEWYYHMRFREDLEGVTPILTDLPPAETLVKPDGSLARPDGGHSNNPSVRRDVLEQKQPQHMAWARERPDGGRGFGFTGGHVHWNWGHDQFRKLVLNAIVWTAGLDVPKDGVPSRPLSVEDLMANQDFPVPENFNPARIQGLLEQWNRSSETSELEHTGDSPDAVQKNLKAGRAVLVDVRSQEEREEGHLKNSIHLPITQLEADDFDRAQVLDIVPRDKIVYTHCRAGGRALRAGKILKELGYDVRPLEPGYEELREAGLERAE
jgi:rhodanese-related sulfurtransferase/type 1 glutamine amidotransferase